jgi:aerobic-type carbon monoxide dehydrogenase small subunit (CoxS/CutS family)
VPHAGGPIDIEVSATINGAAFAGELPAQELLLDFLRDRLGLTGTKQSCEVQVCGACTVLVDGDPVSSCCFLAADIDGREVETIEGLAGSDFHRRAAEAFERHAGVQCGFCTPGMLLTAKALAARGGKEPDDIAKGMNGNLCRCTGYRSILDSLADLLRQDNR